MGQKYYRVTPLSKSNIEKKMSDFRRNRLELLDSQPIPKKIILFLEKKGYTISYEDNITQEGYTISENEFALSAHVYNEVEDNWKSRARNTVMHEVAHTILHSNQMKVVFARGPEKNLKPYENSEWQANRGACELLMPKEGVMLCSSIEDVQDKFGVSQEAAKIRYEEIKGQ